MAWPTTKRFDDALGKSHFVAVRAEILEDDDVIFDLSDPGFIFEGSVSASRSEIQRQAQVSIVDRDGTLAPDDIQDLFMPSGRQIRLWRGVAYPGATPDDVAAGTDRELVPLGTFRYTVTESTYPVVRLDEVYDRAYIVQGAGFENNYTVAKGTQYDDAIRAILWRAYPNVPIDFQDTDELTKLMVFDMGADPWEVCQQLAANIGMRIFFDPLGTCVMRGEPDLQADDIIWTFDDSDANNFALGGLQTMWRGQSYNGIIVVAESSDIPKPLRSFATDADPLSPTKYGGLYGKRLAPIIRDEKITTQSQCDARAKKELDAQLGLFQTVNIPSLVIPQLEVCDLIYALDSKRLRIGARYVVDSFDIPLRGTESMRLSSRARQVTSLEYATTSPGSGLLIDGSSPVLAIEATGTVQALTCASFTPPANAMLLVMWAGNEQGGINVTDATISDTAGLSWTRAQYWDWNTQGAHIAGQLGAWWAFVGSSPSAMTVTITNNASSGSREAALRIYVITGADQADPIGWSDATWWEQSSSLQQTYAATRTGSQGFAMIIDQSGTVDLTLVAGAGTTIDDDNVINADVVYAHFRRTDPDGIGGSNTTLTISSGLNNTHFYPFIAVEVRPAVA